MKPTIEIRTATADDAQDLLNIYAPYVLKTAITFEYKVPSLIDFTSRISNILVKYPYLVAMINDEIVGYSYASAFKTRAAYDWSVETSVYVKENIRGLGVGKLLYQELENILKKQNICNLCACITYPNDPSIAFHTAFSYKQVAHFTKSGYKFDAWHDMIWMEKTLNEHTTPPEPFIPFSDL